MGTNWTDDQKKAIKARGAQTLVAAAAGSGKTAVLTERVKNILCDTENTCSVSEILVVTFTKAAASEMRERIAAALKDELKKTGSPYIRKQLLLLPTADICTIDSFCAKTVKENFHLADISADYSILDEAEEKTLLTDSAESVIEALYEENDESFKSLNRLFLTERDDSALSDILVSVYKYSRSFADPFSWLDEIALYFDPSVNASDTNWAKIITDYIKLMCDYNLKTIKRAIFLMEKEGNFNPEYISSFVLTAGNVERIKNLCCACKWDELVNSIKVSPVMPHNFRNTKADSNIKEFAKNAIDNCSDDFEKLWELTLPDSAEHKCDAQLLYPVVKKMCEAVKTLTLLTLEKKAELNKYSFDDILHKCINILVTFKDGKYQKTQLGESLSSKYKEILIDEYQDTNRAQNIIFEAISRNKTNFYCVGDIKQSIYRFRLASPELFSEMKKELPLYDGTVNASQINLKSNFRSREGITKAVNFVFSRLMSESAGSVDYNETEYLNYGANYNKTDEPDVELHFINATELTLQQGKEYEAKKIASYIRETVEKQAPVFDKKTKSYRPAEYGDFCVLLRSKKDLSTVYKKALNALDIPVVCEGAEKVEQKKEVSVFISLIKTVNNPLSDVSLASVLMSPLFGFTPDELSQIRMVDKSRDLYFCLTKYAQSNEKASKFLAKLSLYRNISSTYRIYDFVKFIAEDTAICNIYQAAKNGSGRQAAIKSVIEYARKFTDDGRNGLSSFVRYLDRVCENEALKCNSEVNLNVSGVKIMTIHKSKGLEFPYVILANTMNKFNTEELKKKMMVSRETGIGLKIRDDEKFTNYHSLSSAACKKSMLNSDLSEELRVLYVALTRPREKLVVFCTNTVKKLCTTLSNVLLMPDIFTKPFDPHYILKCNSMGTWLLSVFILHPDCERLREIFGCNTVLCPDSDFKIKLVCEEYEETDEETETAKKPLMPVDYELLRIISQKSDYTYPYDALCTVLAKRTASSAEKKNNSREYFAQSEPKFISGKLTGALRGTAVHKFLEICDFKSASESVECELSRLLSEELITPEEAQVLDVEAVRCFFNSNVGKRILNADKVYKEYKFSVLRSVKEFYPEIEDDCSGETIVAEGKLDCAFTENGNAVIIDYKTDNITDENTLFEMYKGQLEIYKSAFSECVGVNVSEVYIYSFKLKKFIKVDV